MFKTIIFDLGGVYFTDGTKQAILKLQLDYQIPEVKLEEVFHGEIGRLYRIGKITVSEYWQRANKIWNTNIPEATLSRIWLTGYLPITGTIDLITKLQKNGYELLFLSDNVQERVDYLEEKYHFLNNFKSRIFSHIVKVRKPDPKIYQLVLAQTQNLPTECIYIDDKPELLEPAKALGMTGVHFMNAEELEIELRELGIRLD